MSGSDSPYSSSYTGAERRRRDPYVSASAVHAARILYLFGRTSGGPKPAGAGAKLPSRHDSVGNISRGREYR